MPSVSASLFCCVLVAAPRLAVGQLPPGRASFVLIQADTRDVVNVGFAAASNAAAVVVLAQDDVPDDYRELGVAAGPRLALGGSPTTIAVKLAGGSSGLYAGLVVMPSIARGPLLASSTVLVRWRLSGSASSGYQMNPRLLVRLLSWCRLGVSYVWMAGPATPAEQAFGPAVQLPWPRGTLSLDAALASARTPKRLTLTWVVRW